MATSTDHPKRFSEILRRIDELKACALKDPAQIQKILPSALEEIKTCLEGLSLADEGQKQADAALWESEARFSAFMDNNPANAWMKDDQGAYVFLNKISLEKMGIGLKNWLRKTDHELFPQNIADQLVENDKEVLASGKMIAIEEETVSPDGHHIHWLSYKFPFECMSGKRYVGGIAVDITKLKQAEEKLQENEEKYRHLVEDSLIGIGISHGNQVVFANPALLRIHGYDSLDEFLKVPLLNLVAPQSREDVVQRMRKTSEEKAIPFELEYVALRKDGQIRVLRAYVSYITIEGEIYAQTTFQDITEQKQAEEELLIAKDELELRVQERTVELQRANEILRESEERFRVAIKNSTVLVFNQDKDLRYTWIYHPTPGFTVDASLGKRDEELLPPEEAIFLTEIKRRVIKSGRGERAEVRTIVNGEEYFYDFTIEPLISATGEVEGITCASMDVTERKRAEIELDKYRKHLEDLVKDRTAKLEAANAQLRAEIIERKRAEEAIQNERKQLLSIFDSMDEVVYIADPETYEVLYVNEAFRKNWDQGLGRKCYNVLQHRDTPCPFCTNNRIFGEHLGETCIWEFQNEVTHAWYRCIDRAIQWSDGRMVRFELAIDISDRKRAEEDLRIARDNLEIKVLERTAELERSNNALQDSESRYHDLFNAMSSGVAIYEVKDDGNDFIFKDINPAGEQINNIRQDEVIGKSLYELFTNVHEMGLDNVFKRVWKTGSPEFFPVAAYIDNRISLWVTNYVYRLPSGEIVAIFDDVTKQKQAHERIRFQAALLDQVHNAVIATDLEGNIIYWNKFAKDFLEWTDEEVLGRNIAETVVPEGKLEVMNRVISDLITRGSCEGEFSLRKKDGTIVPTYHSFGTIKDDQGGIIGFIGVATDITERKRAEEALRKSENAMRQAKEAAETAAKAKSEFLANMSHEIRTPMNAVIGMASILLDSGLNHDQRECIETIRSSGDALLAIINDILDFSKIDSGKMALEHQPFDLRSCIKESLDMIATKAVEKGLNLAYIIDGSVPSTIISDPTRLRQIMVNLLSNAIKFTEKGEVEVSVISHALMGGKYQLHFTVRDTGIGIPQDRMDRLFQSFSQIDMSTTRKYGGTGLGLAISKRLVEMMDGMIWVESEMGIGSKFHFALPVDASSGSLPKPKVAPSQSLADAHIGMRILMAEDNPINQRVMLKMLMKIGYRADVAADGLEVLEALKRQHYDLVLMDIQMPEMDGLEAARQIRERWQDGPLIIALTAYALEGDRERCLKAGMDGYISKPVKIDDLRDALLHYEAQMIPYKARE